jgi:hypothetical protein
MATVRMRTVERDTILAEIAKCEIVCANCHRARTHLRRLGVEAQASEIVRTLGPNYVSALMYAM